MSDAQTLVKKFCYNLRVILLLLILARLHSVLPETWYHTADGWLQADTLL